MSERETDAETRAETTDPAPKKRGGARRWISLALKIGFAVFAYWLIFRKILGRDGSEDLFARLSDISWGWIAMGIVMQLVAVTFATFRWRALLGGQGIRPSWRFLAGSIMIARFWGAFTPGGFTGFGGWRIYDVARHTGKTARAAATIGVETFLGQMAMGGVVIAGALLFGVPLIGWAGVGVLVAFFGGVIVVALLILSRPRRAAAITRLLPGPVRVRAQTLIEAACAYEGKTALLGKAFLFGVGVHAFNNLIYVCSAQAFGVELGVGTVFFGANITILATILPASINGLGLREMTAVAFFSSATVGLPESQAILLMAGGFILCEMAVSSVGGLIFLARRGDYSPRIEVDEIEAEERAIEAAKEDEVPRELQPKPLRGLTIGLGAGALAGLIVGLVEATVVIQSAEGDVGLGVLAYGAIAYGIFCAVGGAGLGWGLALTGRWMKRAALAETHAYANTTAFLVASMAFVLGLFRIRRDVFHEQLALKSATGLGVVLGCMLASALLYLLLSRGIRFVVARNPGRIMLRSWGSPAVVAAIAGLVAVGTVLVNGAAGQALPDRRDAPEGAGNVLFVVVDTLRADHLPSYGYEGIETPNLDAFAEDSIRFPMAFANASWTRPSFASIMTGRLPSNHGVMAKDGALADEITTVAEAFREGGWETRGLSTNYNVSPYYNFHQGFDGYEYLEPEFVLGADDAAAKLLLVQIIKRVVEKGRAMFDIVEPGHAYRDAETVNARVFDWLEENEQRGGKPFFHFVGYMDPHDPYFVHPYDGTGYSRAAHQRPDPEEAPRLVELYDGEIEYWDEHFGNLIEELKRRGLYEDMTIVVTADHGEEFCDHGGFWHGTTLYDEQVRVPLFVKLPGNRRGGTRVGHWVQSIDLMPSVLRLAELEVPEGVQGGDIFRGSDVVYAEESHEGNVLEAVRERRGTDEWKLITANEGNPRGLATRELYRVDLDPEETENLAESDEEMLATLEDTVEEQRAQALEGAVEAVTVELTDEDIEQKCRLGYWSREGCCERGFSQYCD